MRAILFIIVFALGALTVSQAEVYYVSPTGNNNSDGLSVGSAWADIDNGEQKGFIAAGDTINILPGTYSVISQIQFKTDGNASAPIVYRAYGGAVLITAGNQSNVIALAEGDYVELHDLEIANSQIYGIHLKGNNCLILDCYLHDLGMHAVFLEGDSNLLLRNTIYQISIDGIHVLDVAQYNLIHNNTISNCGQNGVMLNNSAITERLFNNIIINNMYGINGHSGSICGFNDVWNNSTSNYINGVADSAGGISANPLLTNPAGGDFSLQAGSPAIDTGLDLGYLYIGSKPDLGALEFIQTGGSVYWVSPTGDDDNDGLDSTSAWASVDNGDTKGLIQPGDTINILPGLYSLTAEIELQTSGTSDDPILYAAYGESPAVFDAGGASKIIFVLEGDYTALHGAELTNTEDNAVHITGDHCTVAGCFIHDIGKYGIRVEGTYALTMRNIIARTDDDGIRNEGSGDYGLHYHNTIYGSAADGMDLKESTARVFNCILANNITGLKGNAGNICGFNDVWGNSSNDYSGISDSAGGISANPLFVDAATDDYSLQALSPCLNTALDLGYPYYGSAPDMGAVEMSNTAPVLSLIGSRSVTENINLNFEVAAFDDASIPVLTTTVLPDGASFIDHGDGTGTFDWTPTYLQSGLYDITFYATDDFLEADSETVTITVAEAGNRLPVLTPIGGKATTENVNLNFDIAAADIESIPALSASALPGGASLADHGDGTGTFDWTPGFVQSGVYYVTFYAADDSLAVDSEKVVINVADTSGPGSSIYYVSTAGDDDHDGLTPSSAWLSIDNGDLKGLLGPGDIIRILPGLYETDSTLYLATWGTESEPVVYTKYGDGDVVINNGGASWAGISVTANHVELRSVQVIDAGCQGIYVTGDSCRVSDCYMYNIGWSGIRVDGDDNLIIRNISHTCGQRGFFNYNGDNNKYYNNTAYDCASSGIQITNTIGTARVFNNIFIGNLEGIRGASGNICGFNDVWNNSDGNYLGGVSDSAGGISADPQFIDTAAANFYLQYGSPALNAGLDLGFPYFGTAPEMGARESEAESIRIEWFDGTPFDDTTLCTDDDSTMLYCRGYSAGGGLVGDVSATWTILGVDSIGTVSVGPNSSTDLTLTGPGTGRIRAVYSDSAADTTGIITCLAGVPAQLIISPDTVTVSADSTILFSHIFLDADGNESDPGVMADWSVLGGIGTIDSGGLFSPATSGTGYIVATGYGLTDTSGQITVVSGELNQIVISPDSADINIGDTISFSVTGYDSEMNITAPGDITWKALGRIGDIDSTGRFIATAPGKAKVTAVSSFNNLADTTGFIDVEELYLTGIAIGNKTVHPGQPQNAILAFRIENYYDNNKGITGLTLNDNSRGSGNQPQLITNVDSAGLYLDIDNDSLLTDVDSLIAIEDYSVSTTTSFEFASVVIPPDEGRTFLVGANIDLYPCDGDTLDVLIHPAADIETFDGTPVTGPATVNSLGVAVIDGLVAEQLVQISTGLTEISPIASAYNVFAVDIPCNGYDKDTLNLFSIVNTETAAESDFDSLVLYQDNANNIWNGSGAEIRLGRLVFTGNRWVVSGFKAAMTHPLQRFYVGAFLADYPDNGATISFNIPQNGLNVSSNNDGPIDSATTPLDTITIQTSEAVAIKTYDIKSDEVIPGYETPPILGLQIINGYNNQRTIDSLRLTLYAEDIEEVEQALLDSQIDSVLIYLDRDDDIENIGDTDSLLATAVLVDGTCMLTTGNLVLSSNGGTIDLAVTLALDAENGKNGNTLNIGPADSSDIYFSETTVIEGSFPLRNTESFTINAYQAERIVIDAIPGKTLVGGQVNQMVFSFTLPGNGYADDILSTLQLINADGQGLNDAPITVKLWADDGQDGISVGDASLGQFGFFNSYWEITNLNYPVPSTGAAFYVTIDIANTQFNGGTLRFGIPVAGARYKSDLIGPDDKAAVSSASHLIIPSNRVTAIAIPASSTIIYPGSKNNMALSFALYNGYLDRDQTLRSITFTNISHSRSDLDFADHELGQVALYYDADRNRTYQRDSLIATGYFSDGKLSLTGLNVALPAESLSYFFVVIDVPPDIIDSDSLAVSINAPTDFSFLEPVNVNGNLPLTNGGYLVVDGSVYQQYKTLPLESRTLAPGDTSVTLFAFIPALNGDQPDTLETIVIDNLFDADSSDIEPLELWIDLNHDSTWQETDSLLAVFNYVDSLWQTDGLNLEIIDPAPILFVLGDVSLSATPGTAFRAKLPLNGCHYSSLNDGPLDRVLVAAEIFTVSTSGLALAVQPLNETYSVGQEIAVRMNVTNISLNPIDNITGEITYISDSSLVTLDSTEAGPVNLAVDETTTFTFHFTADSAGMVLWRMRAVANDINDTSALVETEPITIQIAPDSVVVQMINTIPTSVTRGQTNVFPFSVRILQPDTSSSLASLRLDSLRIVIENGSGQPMNASEALSRMVLATGYTNLCIIDNIPDQPEILMDFSEPIIITSGQQYQFTLLVDIDSLALADNFALAITDEQAIVIVDQNADQPVTISPATPFPMRTASCRIDDPSQTMALSYESLLPPAVNFGQYNVDVLRLRLFHPGESGSSQIQLTGLSMAFVDNFGDTLVIPQLLDEVRLVRQSTVIASVYDFEIGAGSLDIQLNSPITLSPGEIDSLKIQVMIGNMPAYSGFALHIADSTAFVIRDLSSGSLLQAVTDTNYTLASESIFPINSSFAGFEYPAIPPELCLVSRLPESVVGGVDALPLFDIFIEYPADSGFASLDIQDIRLTVLDTLGIPLDPDHLFDRIGYRISGGNIYYQSFIRLQSGYTVFDLDDSAIMVTPGDTLTLELVADIESDALYDNFVLEIPSFQAINIRDANDTAHTPQIEAGCAFEMPFQTGVSSIFLPAGRPALQLRRQPTLLAYPGQADAVVLSGHLRYDNPSPLGDLALSSVSGKFLQRTASGYVSPESDVFRSVSLIINDNVVAVDSQIVGDSLSLVLDEELIIRIGSNLEMELRCEIDSAAAPGNYTFRFGDSSFMAIADHNLETPCYIILDNGSYPLYASEISLAAENLGSSFSNFTNPFNPAHEPTVIGYNLPEAAQVDIEIFTITGEMIKRVADNAFRAAGPHREDIWMGRNDGNFDVLPGTYFCRITARYVSGGTEEYRRKIAVIR
nr:right-handed parallel beta-helix repeat-containing protein [candidate division Zixibacteria bacterium]